MILYFIATIFKRSYTYLALTFFSIMVGAFLFGAILSVTQSISNYFVREGKTIIGGDIVLSSPREIREEDASIQNIIAKSEKVNREYSVQAVFKNAVSTSTAVASVRAVEESFPLYGKVELEDNSLFSLGENKNRVYVEKSFLDRVDAQVGDEVLLGEGTYTIAGVIKKEPDSISGGVSFTPKVIMLLSDFKQSGIDVTQSRATYTLSVKENKDTPFAPDDILAIKNYSKDNKIRFDDSTDGPNNLVRGLLSVQSFSGIVLGIALFLVVVNIIANLSYVISKFKSTIAILKTFGATSRQIQLIYISILSFLGFVAGFLGALLGAFLSNGLLPILSRYIEGPIEKISILPVATVSGGMGLCIIVASALPFFLSLHTISPKQLLAKIALKNNRRHIKSSLFYIPVPILLFTFLYLLSSNLALSLYSVLGLIGIFLLFLAIAFTVVYVLYKKRAAFTLVIRSSIASLKWKGVETAITIASIMTAFSGIFIISAIEKNIIENLNQSISNTAPALYIVDINKSQLAKVRDISGESFTEYPVIRGRLLKVNDRDMTLSNDPGITREFSMTYRSNLLPGEKITSGVWHGDSKQSNAVSVDNSFAEEIGGVEVGDSIDIFVQGITVTVTVASLHDAERSGGTPFFFLVFSPDVLSNFPASYFATVSASGEEIKTIEARLGNEFPNIIPIQTGKIIDTVTTLLQSVILVVKIIGIPSLILGLILIMVMTSQSLYERKRDVLILRAFGLTKKNIITLFVVEVSFIIVLASAISYGIAHGIAFLLNKTLFNFEIFAFTSAPLYMTGIILIIVIVFGYFISSSVTKSSLKEMLAEK